MFQKLKRAFGFSTSTDEEEEEIFLSETVSDTEEKEDDGERENDTAAETENHAGANDCDATEDTDSAETPESSDSHDESDPTGEAVSPDIVPSLSGRLFDEVIRLFNQWQPEFVSNCIDTEAQRRFIYDSIDSELRSEIEEALHPAGQDTTDETEAAEERRLQSSEEDTDPVKEQLEELHNELDRITLEKETLEKEKSDLIAAAKQNVEETASLKQRVEELEILQNISQEDINNAKTLLLTAEANLGLRDKRVDELEKELSDLRSAVTELSSQNDEMVQRNRELEEIRRRRDVMVAEANAKAYRIKTDSERTLADNAAELTTLRQRNAELEISLKSTEGFVAERESLRSDISGLQAQNEGLKTEVERLTQKLTESEERYKAAMEGLREAPTPLPTSRKRGRPKKTAVPMPETNGNPAQTTGTENIAAEPHPRAYADPDSILKPDNDAPVREEATAASKRKVKPTISAIEELLSGADWMESPQPQKRSAKRQKPREEEEEDDDFGYKAPPRKQHPDSEAQMSLW